MNLLITGTSGFIGGHLLGAAKAAGHKVTQLRHSETIGLHGDVLVGDLAALRNLPENCFHTIIHTAGLSWPGDVSVADLARANVQGTSRLAAAAAKAGIPRIIFLSSLSALGKNISSSSYCSERTPPVDPDAYGLSKLLCERLLAEHSKFSSLSIRLPAVLGKGAVRHFMARTAAQAMTGGDIEAHSPRRLFNNVLWIQDLCDFILAQLYQAPTNPQHDIVHVAANNPLRMDEVLQCLCVGTSSRSRVVWGTPPSYSQPAATVDTGKATQFYGFKPLSVWDTLARYTEVLKSC